MKNSDVVQRCSRTGAIISPKYKTGNSISKNMFKTVSVTVHVKYCKAISSKALENAQGFGGLNKPSHQREQQEIY